MMMKKNDTFDLNTEPLLISKQFLIDEATQSIPIQEGVPILLPSEFKSFIDSFEEKYNSHDEPWDYSKRAVEQVRHCYVAEKAKKLIGNGKRILDIGCALGQLTSRLKGISSEVWGIDISPTATVKAKKNLDLLEWDGFRIVAASATDLPFKNESFRLVILSDGLVGWELSQVQKMRVLSEVKRVLEPGGFAILTDYLPPKYFKSHKESVLQGPLEFVSIDYLGDRIGFQIANNLKPVANFWPIKKMLASLKFNLFLSQISKPLGPAFSKHISIILRKQSL